MQTPWGESQEVEPILRGVVDFVSTAGHGGFRVHKEYQGTLPPSPFLNSQEWYEEDCDWAVAWLGLYPILNARRYEMSPWYRERFDEITNDALRLMES